MSIRLTIEEVFGDRTEIIHLNVQELDPRQDRNRAIRFMLSAAGECFPDPPAGQYPYDSAR